MKSTARTNKVKLNSFTFTISKRSLGAFANLRARALFEYELAPLDALSDPQHPHFSVHHLFNSRNDDVMMKGLVRL